MQPYRLQAEHRDRPLGIGTASPRLSWSMGAASEDSPAHVRVLVASSAHALINGHADLWDSGPIPMKALNVRYAGKALGSRRRCHWRVVSADSRSDVVDSEPSWFETGMLETHDWVAEWITGPVAPRDGVQAPGSTRQQPGSTRFRLPDGLGAVTYLSRAFEVVPGEHDARLYAAALGLYHAYVNGERVDARAFAPGWTDYHKRVEYQAYDVSALLQPGRNAICLVLADGWYAGYVGFSPKRRGAFYGARAAICAQLEIGGVPVVVTDRSWHTGFGPIIWSDLLMGESRDEREALTPWLTAAPPATEVWAAITRVGSAPQRVAERGPPISTVMTVPARAVAWLAADIASIDFGQNLSGRIRLQATGDCGTEIRIRHAETLDAARLYTENLRTARAEDRIVIGPSGRIDYEPSFTFHGFRYAELKASNASLRIECAEAKVIMSALERTGRFRCGHALVQRIYDNALWSQRSNFLSVPTDCPQRDERLGWLGDAQVFARTAAYNFDVAAFFEKWLGDVLDAQRSDGAFTDIAPLIIFENGGAPGWAEAGVLVPWTLWQMYGDPDILERCWPAMQRFFEFQCRHNEDGVRRQGLNLNFGDWLNVDDDTPKELIATAFWARTAAVLRDIAAVLGEVEAEAHYGREFDRIRLAFQREFLSSEGQLHSDAQGASVLSLAFGLLTPAQHARAFNGLVAAIERRGYATCGFLSINALLPTLSAGGRSDLAYRLLLREDYPSWGYSVRHGATTIWERWDSWTPENGFQKEMNSFNHYAFGSVAEWLYRFAAGLDFDDGGVARRCIEFRPQPCDALGWCEAEYESALGSVSSAWRIAGDRLTLALAVPPAATARLHWPSGWDPIEAGSTALGPGSHRFEAARSRLP